MSVRIFFTIGYWSRVTVQLMTLTLLSNNLPNILFLSFLISMLIVWPAYFTNRLITKSASFGAITCKLSSITVLELRVTTLQCILANFALLCFLQPFDRFSANVAFGNSPFTFLPTNEPVIRLISFTSCAISHVGADIIFLMLCGRPVAVGKRP